MLPNARDAVKLLTERREPRNVRCQASTTPARAVVARAEEDDYGGRAARCTRAAPPLAHAFAQRGAVVLPLHLSLDRGLPGLPGRTHCRIGLSEPDHLRHHPSALFPRLPEL